MANWYILMTSLLVLWVLLFVLSERVISHPLQADPALQRLRALVSSQGSVNTASSNDMATKVSEIVQSLPSDAPVRSSVTSQGQSHSTGSGTVAVPTTGLTTEGSKKMFRPISSSDKTAPVMIQTSVPMPQTGSLLGQNVTSGITENLDANLKTQLKEFGDSVAQAMPVLSSVESNNSFPSFEISLLDSDETNGMRLLFDSPQTANVSIGQEIDLTDRLSGNISYPERLLPVLVCDVIVKSLLYDKRGPGAHREHAERDIPPVVKWRVPYFRKQPQTCQLIFRHFGNSTNLLKVQMELLLVRLITDGRIISSNKFNRLLHDQIISLSPTSKLPVLNPNIDPLKIVSFLSPHGSSVLGVPHSSDPSDYPRVFSLDTDIFITNTSLSLQSLFSRISDGLKLPIIGGNHKNQTLQTVRPEASDFIVATDQQCAWNPEYSSGLFNTGVFIYRPTTFMADLFRIATLSCANGSDQGATVVALDQVSEFNRVKLMKSCSSTYNKDELIDRIMFVEYANKSKMIEKNRQFLDLLHKLDGGDVTSDDDHNNNKSFAMVLNQRWMNSNNNAAWRSGDWINHFYGENKNKKMIAFIKKMEENNFSGMSVPDHPINITRIEEEGIY